MSDKAAFADKLTAKLTAFRTFADFVKSMKGGYIPSIYPENGRRYRILRRLVRAEGFRVYPYNTDN